MLKSGGMSLLLVVLLAGGAMCKPRRTTTATPMEEAVDPSGTEAQREQPVRVVSSEVDDDGDKTGDTSTRAVVTSRAPRRRTTTTTTTSVKPPIEEENADGEATTRSAQETKEAVIDDEASIETSTSGSTTTMTTVKPRKRARTTTESAVNSSGEQDGDGATSKAISRDIASGANQSRKDKAKEGGDGVSLETIKGRLPFLDQVSPDVAKQFQKILGDTSESSERVRQERLDLLAVSFLNAEQLKQYETWATGRGARTAEAVSAAKTAAHLTGDDQRRLDSLSKEIYCILNV